jgi:hypothetical protein
LATFLDAGSDIAYELSLAEGLRLERRLFQGLFATQDQKEGMFNWATPFCVMLKLVLIGLAAFVEKRKPVFTHL